MKTKIDFRIGKLSQLFLVFLVIFSWSNTAKAREMAISRDDSLNFVQYRGYVVEMDTRKPLGFATLTLEGANLSTVANSDGEFLFKVPVVNKDGNVIVSYLGHKNKILRLSDLKPDKNRIELELLSVTLTTV